MNEIVIERPELQAPVKRALFNALTAVMWSFYIYLLLPVATLIAWWIGFSSVYEEMVMRRGWESLVSLLGWYGFIVALIAVGQVGWALVNWARFKGKRDRRRLRERAVDMSVDHMFGDDLARSGEWLDARRLTVQHHKEEHKITAVQVG